WRSFTPAYSRTARSTLASRSTVATASWTSTRSRGCTATRRSSRSERRRMRFSAWSLRVISVCSALVFVPSAWAHLSVSPTRVSVGEAVDLTFGASNEDDDLGIDHVTLTVPAGFEVDDAEAKPGWTQSRSGES